MNSSYRSGRAVFSVPCEPNASIRPVLVDHDYYPVIAWWSAAQYKLLSGFGRSLPWSVADGESNIRISNARFSAVIWHTAVRWQCEQERSRG